MPILRYPYKRSAQVAFSLNFSAFQVVKFLIEKKVPATYTDTLNQTALYYAAREGKTNCIDLFISSGTGY